MQSDQLQTTSMSSSLPQSDQTDDIYDRVEHRFASSGSSSSTKIHYVTIGQGPLIVCIHGFPDHWYVWRDYLSSLSVQGYQVVAMDQRGYNKSDKPLGVENYAFKFLVEDVAAVIKDCKCEDATIMGHDWGGYVAWTFATRRPEMTNQLVVFNFPHPRCLRRELVHNPIQAENSAYARKFQEEGAHLTLTAEGLAGSHRGDPVVFQRYVEANKRTDFEVVLNFYKANYPRHPYTEDDTPIVKVQSPVLQFHGLDDPYLMKGALNDTWTYLEQDLTLVAIPNSGHWAVNSKSDFIMPTLVAWLAQKIK